MGAHITPISVEHRPLTAFVEQWRCGDQVQLHPQMDHPVDVNVGQRRKATEILAALQQRRQYQAAGIAQGLVADEITSAWLRR